MLKYCVVIGVQLPTPMQTEGQETVGFYQTVEVSAGSIDAAFRLAVQAVEEKGRADDLEILLTEGSVELVEGEVATDERVMKVTGRAFYCQD